LAGWMLDGWFAGLLVTKSRLGEPRSESHQIKISGTDFVGFWSQGQKLIKSILLGMILSTSGAKVTKSLNQDFWD
jgi:hypothetical protein